MYKNQLRKRPTYDEVIDYIEAKQPKVKYPNRLATQILNTPQMSQFLGDGNVNMRLQQEEMLKQQMLSLELERAGISTREAKALSTQTGNATAETEYYDLDSDVEHVGETLNKEETKQLEKKGTMAQEAATHLAMETVPEETAHKTAERLRKVAGTLGQGVVSVASTLGQGVSSVLDAGQEMYDFNTQFYKNAAQSIVQSVSSSARSNIKHLFEKTQKLNFDDVLKALQEAAKRKPTSDNFLTDAIDRNVRLGKTLPDWNPSNPTLSLSSSSSSSQAAQASQTAQSSTPNYVSYNTISEWETKGKTKGLLVEQVYMRPNWADFLGVVNASGFHKADSGGELRQKLGKMTRKDLAKLLLHLDGKD